jgi:xanthine dehydrogenase small subunit
VTIEGLNRNQPGPIQRAFEAQGASQCGFCTPGFIISFVGHLLETDRWDEDRAVEAVAGNICRCTGYASIRRALAHVLDLLGSRVDLTEARVPALVREGVLPEYFLRVGELVRSLEKPQTPQPPTASQLIVAGGTDLYVQRPTELPNADVWVMPIETERPIWREGEQIYLAATATAEDMKRSQLLDEKVGGIETAMRLMGSLPIRQRATIGGNLVNASPIGDMTIVLLALDAEIGLAAGEKHRSIPLREFFLGYKHLDLGPGELVKWVRFSSPPSGSLFNFEKVSRRRHLDIASVNSALALDVHKGKIRRACLSAGGVAPVPLQLPRTAEHLLGRQPDAATALAAADIARSEVAPISDVRGSADYKRLLLGQLVLAHFHVLFGIEAGFFQGATA